MAGRSYSFNGYEASLSSPISAGSTTIALDSTAGLQEPGYLVIEPSSPTLREYVYFTGINGNELTGVSRGLQGSITPGAGVGHDANVKIRAVPVHQHLDDIWGPDGIEGAGTALATHEADPSPHPTLLTEAEADALYLQVDGGNQMDADLDMGDTNKITKLANGTLDTDAPTLKQVTDGDAAVTTAFEAGDSALDSAKVDKSGDSMTGALAMGGNKITGLANGVSAQDAATVAQLGSVDAPSHDGLADGSPGVGQTWANKHHTRYTDSEAVAAVHSRYTDSEAVSAMGAKSDSNDLNHDRYTDAEAVAAGSGTYAPISFPNFSTYVQIGNWKTIDRVGGFAQLWAGDGTDAVLSGDGDDELYLGGIPFDTGVFNLACDESGANRRIKYEAKASSRRFKQDEKPSTLEGGECLKWDFKEFRYIPDVKANGDDARVNNWQMAEDLLEASGEQFIKRDGDGEVLDTDDRAIMADMILTIQALEARIAELEAS